MSIFPCPDCDKSVSKRAVSCPHCGCPFRDAVESKPAEIVVKQKSSMGCAGFIGLVFLGLIIYSTFSSINKTLDPEPQVPKTAEQVRADKIFSAFNGWDGSHRHLSQMVKSALKDPDSYEHIDTRYSDNGDHVYIEMSYRAKNSFGGYAVETVTAKASIEGVVLEILSSP